MEPSSSWNAGRRSTASNQGISPYAENYRPQIASSQRHLIIHRQVVAKLSRKELEDKYINMCDENFCIKKNFHEQSEQVKKLKAKLQRLSTETGRSLPGSNFSKIFDLESQRLELRDKLESLRINHERKLTQAQPIGGFQKRPFPQNRATSAPHQHQQQHQHRQRQETKKKDRPTTSGSSKNMAKDKNYDEDRDVVSYSEDDEEDEEPDQEQPEPGTSAKAPVTKSCSTCDVMKLERVALDADLVKLEMEVNFLQKEIQNEKEKNSLIAKQMEEKVSFEVMKRNAAENIEIRNLTKTVEDLTKQLQDRQSEDQKATEEDDEKRAHLEERIRNEKDNNEKLFEEVQRGKRIIDEMKQQMSEIEKVCDFLLWKQQNQITIHNENKQLHSELKTIHRQGQELCSRIEQLRTEEELTRTQQQHLWERLRMLQQDDDVFSVLLECLRADDLSLPEEKALLEIERDFLQRQQENFTKLLDENKLLRFQLDEVRAHGDELSLQLENVQEAEVVAKAAQQQLLERLKALQADNDQLLVSLEGLRSENGSLMEERNILEDCYKTLQVQFQKDARFTAVERAECEVQTIPVEEKLHETRLVEQAEREVQTLPVEEKIAEKRRVLQSVCAVQTLPLEELISGKRTVEQADCEVQTLAAVEESSPVKTHVDRADSEVQTVPIQERFFPSSRASHQHKILEFEEEAPESEQLIEDDGEDNLQGEAFYIPLVIPSVSKMSSTYTDISQTIKDMRISRSARSSRGRVVSEKPSISLEHEEVLPPRQVRISHILPRFSILARNFLQEPESSRDHNVSLLLANAITKRIHSNDASTAGSSRRRDSWASGNSVTSSSGDRRRISFKDDTEWFHQQMPRSAISSVFEGEYKTEDLDTHNEYASLHEEHHRIRKYSKDLVHPTDYIALTIKSVHWHPATMARLLERKVQHFYVELQFLDESGSYQMETSTADLLGEGGMREIPGPDFMFDHRIIFKLNEPRYTRRRELLRRMLEPNGKDKVRFSIVHEHLQVQNCTDIGFASFRLRQEIQRCPLESIATIEVPIYDVVSPKDEMGYLWVQLEGIELLRTSL
ncbi:restin homolog isoform X1 [Uranotaenia lowii]|uniref:restin homolog isoform X1 n=1 Tax=Uranotaenia lowii TaxID=190385 RepID=UPI00247988F7|nr:restin homolog isoform X1 [Uranotaenia lowii]